MYQMREKECVCVCVTEGAPVVLVAVRQMRKLRSVASPAPLTDQTRAIAQAPPSLRSA